MHFFYNVRYYQNSYQQILLHKKVYFFLIGEQWKCSELNKKKSPIDNLLPKCFP